MIVWYEAERNAECHDFKGAKVTNNTHFGAICQGFAKDVGWQVRFHRNWGKDGREPYKKQTEKFTDISVQL